LTTSAPSAGDKRRTASLPPDALDWREVDEASLIMDSCARKWKQSANSSSEYSEVNAPSRNVVTASELDVTS
jgi:hypothetical protein